MPLVSINWQSQLQGIFTQMRNMQTDTGNDFMAQMIATTFASYLATAVVQSTDTAAAVPGGVSYVGVGVGTISIVPSQLSVMLAAHFKNTQTDLELANYIANDLDSAMQSAVIVTTSTGTAITPTGSPMPFAGAGTGSFIGVPTLISGQLITTFNSMKAAMTGDDLLFAQTLASAVTTYLQSAQVPITLQPPFVGGTGVGKLL